ncbi:hypothetical protein SAMN04488057_109145 [Cyclobacterium lianum]|uniref:NAD dependent epimerase/dehydratase family protein n=2 Tax=Cyclobacterium lianum TaxID=388280 RepID=A0A1M7PM25_9BACT|nr:hypothetical protein SAMN04488057_109145 [Cyclobacterium lianum]
MNHRIVFVAGSSGMVGMQLLHQLFQHPEVDWVVSFGRRELALKHQKLVQVKVNFDRLDQVDVVDEVRKQNRGGDFQSLLVALERGDDRPLVFCSLGTTIRQAGSKDDFYRIDHDYVISFARMSLRYGAKRFAYVSAIGADAQSSIFYNKVKGTVEDDLRRMDFEYLGLFQPSLLLGDRKENRLGEEVGKVLMRAVTFLGLFKKYKPIYDHQVARAMVKKMLNSQTTGNETITSLEMHKMTK